MPACNFIKKKLRHRCFPVYFFRIPINSTCKSHVQNRVAASNSFTNSQENTSDRVPYTTIAGQKPRIITQKNFIPYVCEVFQKSVFAEHFWIVVEFVCGTFTKYRVIGWTKFDYITVHCVMEFSETLLHFLVQHWQCDEALMIKSRIVC